MKKRIQKLAWPLAALLPNLVLAQAAAPASAPTGAPTSAPASPASRATEPVRAAIAAGKAEEVCMKLERGDTLHWRFSADVPLSFNLHQHLDSKVDMPVNLRAMRADDGRFVVTHSNDWCLMWTAPKDRAAVLEGQWSKTPATSK